MVRFWNKDLKRILFVMTMIVLLGGAAINLALYQYEKQLKSDSFEMMVGMVETIVKYYPETSEEEVIRMIAGEEDLGQGREVLAKYGIFEKNFRIPDFGKGRMPVGWITFGICMVTLLLAGSAFLIFWKERNRRLNELCHYVDRISLGDEDLDIRNNDEDELSGLRNELYKLMVAWREKAGNEKEGKLALTKAVENISHQLKTPLTSVVVLADNILEDDKMDPKVQKKFLQEISRQLIGMKWLVVTLLKLSRLDAGVVELSREKCSLKKILEEAIKNLEINAQWKEIGIQTKFVDGEILGDEKWLTEGFQNIIKNALEYSPQKGIVEIETEDNDVYAQVAIRDHGPGIPEEAQKHLFERFYRASKVENENIGIGLALAKEIIERQNGYVTVNSGNEGTEFIIKFLKHF